MIYADLIWKAARAEHRKRATIAGKPWQWARQTKAKAKREDRLFRLSRKASQLSNQEL
jgi:hypothetical protein